LIYADFTKKFNKKEAVELEARRHPKENSQNFQLVRFQKDGEETCIKVFLRPGLYFMLESLKPKFELILFTAGSREYMEEISHFLKDPNHPEGYSYFDHLLCKDYMRALEN
jgi:hypothetical protein